MTIKWRHIGTFNGFFLAENICIFITISTQCLPHSLISSKQVTSHYLNQWWSTSLTHIYITRPWWVNQPMLGLLLLTHWGRVTHVCIDKLTLIGWDNALSPGWRQAIIWTNAGILLIEPFQNKLEMSLILSRPQYANWHHCDLGHCVSILKAWKLWPPTVTTVTYNYNPLALCEAIWHQRFWQTLAWVVTCCLMAPSQYLKQCWLNNQWGLVAFT